MRTKSEHANILSMSRRPGLEKPDILSEEDLQLLRHNLAHLSSDGVRAFLRPCFRGLPAHLFAPPQSPEMQTLVQVWKQLWKWRRR